MIGKWKHVIISILPSLTSSLLQISLGHLLIETIKLLLQPNIKYLHIKSYIYILNEIG